MYTYMYMILTIILSLFITALYSYHMLKFTFNTTSCQ